MPEDLTASRFASQIDTTFLVVLDGAPPVALELFEVSETDSTPAHEQFSILFRGPLDRVLSQGMCRMEHAALGRLVLFIVPIGLDAQGMQYQAVFSRVRTLDGTSR